MTHLPTKVEFNKSIDGLMAVAKEIQYNRHLSNSIKLHARNIEMYVMTLESQLEVIDMKEESKC